MLPTTRGPALALAMLALAPGISHADILEPCPSYPGPPETVVECFDDEPSGSAASAGDFGNMTLLDGLILSESDAAFLLGTDTTDWATSGDQGILNALLPAVDFLFDAPIALFRLSVVALAGPLGEPVPVVVQGFAGDELRATAISDVSRVRDDGTHADWIDIQDAVLGFDRVSVFAALEPCNGENCEVGTTTSFFADTVKYIVPDVVPEPGVAVLGLASLAGFGVCRGGRRREGNLS